MKCPVCSSVDLVMTERQGIEIDYCPTCRGVWLDRGELDKVIDRSMATIGGPSAPQSAPYAAPPPAPYVAPPPHQEHRGGKHHDHDDHHGYGKHRKKSFLQELFD